MALSSRTPPTGQPVTDPPTFQWEGPQTADQYTAATTPPPAPVSKPVVSRLSSRAGEGTTVLPKPAAPVKINPETVVQKSLEQQADEADATRKVVNQAYASGNASLKDAVWAASPQSFGDLIVNYTPLGGVYAAGTHYFPSQKERQAQQDQMIKDNPEMAQQILGGEGEMHSWWRKLTENFATTGIDLAEVGAKLGTKLGDPTGILEPKVGEMANAFRAKIGLTPADESKPVDQQVIDTAGQFANAFKQMGINAWQIAKEPDPTKRRKAMGDAGLKVANAFVTGVPVVGGALAEAQKALTYSNDANFLYYKGVPVRALTPEEKKGFSVGEPIGGLAAGIALWPAVSRVFGAQLLASSPALTTFAEAHPYLFAVGAVNGTVEGFNAAVSKMAGAPYGFGNTVMNLGMYAAIETAGLAKAKITGTPYRTEFSQPPTAKWLDGIDVQAAAEMADNAAEEFMMQNKRMPSGSELQDIIGEKRIPGSREMSFNEANALAAREAYETRAQAQSQATVLNDNKVIGLTGGEKGRPGIDRPAEPVSPYTDLTLDELHARQQAVSQQIHDLNAQGSYKDATNLESTFRELQGAINTAESLSPQTKLLADFFGTTPADIVAKIQKLGTNVNQESMGALEQSLGAEYGKDYKNFADFVDKKLGDSATAADFDAMEHARMDAQKISADAASKIKPYTPGPGVETDVRVPGLPGHKDLDITVTDGKLYRAVKPAEWDAIVRAGGIDPSEHPGFHTVPGSEGTAYFVTDKDVLDVVMPHAKEQGIRFIATDISNLPDIFNDPDIEGGAVGTKTFIPINKLELVSGPKTSSLSSRQPALIPDVIGESRMPGRTGDANLIAGPVPEPDKLPAPSDSPTVPSIRLSTRGTEPPKVLTPEHVQLLTELTPSDRRFVRDNTDVIITEKSPAAIKRLQRLEGKGLVQISPQTDKAGVTAIVTPAGKEFAQTAKQDLPPAVAPKRGQTVEQVYGQTLAKSTYQGKPVTTNSYVLEFQDIPDQPYLGTESKVNGRATLPETAIAKIVAPAMSADVQLQPVAYRDAVSNRDMSSMFLQGDGGALSRVDLGYYNYFRNKYGNDIQFFAQTGGADPSPVTVRSADGQDLGLIMPMRVDQASPPRPIQLPSDRVSIQPETAAVSQPASGLSSRGPLPAEIVRLLGEAGYAKTHKGLDTALTSMASKDELTPGERALYEHVNKVATRSFGKAPAGGGKGGGGGKATSAAPAAPGGKPERPSLSSRKPKPLSETAPARSSRLRDRLAQTTDAKIESPRQGDIVKFLQDQFTAPIRVGKNSKGSLGTFYPQKNVIRIKNALDIPTAAHEIGHYLDNEYGLRGAVKSGSRYIEPYRNELLQLGEPTSKPSYTTKQKVGEGIAEFVRRYITDPQSLSQMAPNFLKYFEDQLPPEGIRLLKEARNAHEQMMAQSPEYRVKSHISTEVPESPFGQRVKKTVDAVFSAIDDDLLMIRKFVTDAEAKIGEDVAFKNDPYVLARLTRGMDGKVMQFLSPRLTPFDGTGRPLTNVRSLGAILENVPDRGDFEAYLVAKRAQDLHKENIVTGISPADADSVVQTMEARHANFPKLQQEIVTWNRSLLSYAKERGFLSEQQVTDMTKNGDNYVPFFRVIDELTTKGKGKGFGDVASPFKSIKGSTRQIISPIESMTKNAYVIMSAVERNRVGQAIAALAKRHPDLGAYFEKIPAGVRPIQVNAAEIMKKLGIEEPTDAAQGTITLFVHGSKPNATGENIQMVVNDGKAEYYSVDPLLYKALAGINDESANIIMRILQKPAAVLRAGATLTPEFIGRNPIRDQMSAFIYSKGNYIPVLDFFRGLSEAIRQGPDYQRAAIGGAMQSAFVSLDRPSLKSHIDSMFASRGEKVAHYFLHPLDALRALSEFGEVGTRIGEARKVFAKQFAKTGDYEEALTRSAFAARNATVDFSRRGWAGKNMNMITAFWNANVQDVTKFARELSGREKGGNPGSVAWKALLALTVPSLAFYAMSKDDERYKELPRWQKDYFWIAAIPGVPLIRIPKPFLPGMIFGSLPVRMLEAHETGSLRPLRDLFTSLRESNTPGITPTAMLPIIEYATNYSTFFGKQTVPLDEQSLLPADQYGIYTSETAKAVGKALNLSPLKIEALVYGYTAGLGRYATSMLDYLGGKTGALPERPPAPEDPAQIPVLRAFMISDLATTGQSVSDFYDAFSRAEQVHMSINNAIGDGNKTRLKEITTQNMQDMVYIAPDGSPQMLYDALSTTATILSDLKKERESTLTATDISPLQKTVRIEKINSAMRLVARNAIAATEQRPKNIDDLRSRLNP